MAASRPREEAQRLISESSFPAPGRSVLEKIADILDWTLLPALVGAIPFALIGAKMRGSQGALAFAILGAFAGATLGAIGWAAWEAGKKKGPFTAALVGALTGLIISAAFRALYEPIPALTAGVKQAILGKIAEGLVEWAHSAWLSMLLLGAVVGTAIGVIARMIRWRDS